MASIILAGYGPFFEQLWNERQYQRLLILDSTKTFLVEFIFNSIIYKFILQMSFSVTPDKLLTTNELHSQILVFVMEM